MKRRPWPIATLIFGLATLAVFIAFGMLPEVKGVYEPSAVGAEVSAFQRAETMADLARVFGEPADPARLAAMTAINTLDLYAFIPAYTLFLVLAAIMLATGTRSLIAWAAILFALIGAGADAIETTAQLRVTQDYANAAAQLPIAPWHWMKYFCLALHGAMLTVFCCVSRKRWILAVLAFAPLVCVSLAAARLVPPTLYSAAFGVFWVALLVIAVMELVRAKGEPA